MSEFFRAEIKGQCLLMLVIFGFVGLPRSAHANIYATNIRLGGTTSNVTNYLGESVSISYILNEAASAGVTIRVLSGSTVVRTMSLPPGSPGTARGLNTVLWDGLDNASNSVPVGTYNLSVTAASSGFSSWTNLTSDSDPNTYVNVGRGIAVDQNPTSPFYGRIFVANSTVGISPVDTPGDNVGILKFNADSSTPDDGVTNAVDHAWSGDGFGPRKLVLSGGDQLYALDQGNQGNSSAIFSWQPDFSSNSFVPVLTSGNRPVGARLNGLTVTRQGTNTQLWASDSLSNFGVLKWVLGTNGACDSGDLGLTVVGIGDTNNLSLPPQDVAVDGVGNIYVCQSVTSADQATPTVLRFPAYDPSTNGGAPELIADWAIGGSTNIFGGATGIAVDPSGTYVAVSFEGVLDEIGFPTNGNTKVLYTTNGAVAAEVDLHFSIQGDFSHQDTACAWDAVGNLYYIDNYWGRWRAVSPPGTNQATTIAPSVVQIVALPAAEITGITVSNGVVTISFTASVSDTADAFVVLSSASLAGPFTVALNASIVQVGPGLFRATLPQSGSAQFYKVERAASRPPQPPYITNLGVAAGMVRITFSGAANDPPAAFTLLSAGTAGGPFVNTAGATISGSNGVFLATAPTNGAIQFYRIQR